MFYLHGAFQIILSIKCYSPFKNKTLVSLPPSPPHLVTTQRAEVLQYKHAVLKQLKEQKIELLAKDAKEKEAKVARAPGSVMAPVRPVQSGLKKAPVIASQSNIKSSQVLTADRVQQAALQVPKVGTGNVASSTCAMPQKAKAGFVTQHSVTSRANAAESSIGIAAQGMGSQQHAVTRRSAVRLEADAAAAASTGSTNVSHLLAPDPRTQNEIEREKLMNKLSLRESRLILGLQTTAPLLQRPRTHWDHLLEEVQWLALDFRQEHRWKMNYSTSLALMCEEKVAKHDLRSVTKEVKAAGADKAILDFEGQDAGANESAPVKGRDIEEDIEERKKTAKAMAAEIRACWASVGGPRAEYFPEQKPVEEKSNLTEELAHSNNAVASATFFDAPTLMGVSDSSNAFTTRKQLQKAVAAAAINSVTPVVSNVPEPPPVLIGAAYGLNTATNNGSSSYKFDFFTETASKFSASIMKCVHENCSNHTGHGKRLVSSNKLLPHQVDVGNKVLALCSNTSVPAGSLLYGKEAVGKTAVSVAVAATWLQDPFPVPKVAESAPDIHATDISKGKHPQVIIVVPTRSMLRWLSEIKRMCPNHTVETFGLSRVVDDDDETNSNSSERASFLLCAMEQMGDLLYDPSGPFYIGGVSKAPKEEKSEGAPELQRRVLVQI